MPEREGAANKAPGFFLTLTQPPQWKSPYSTPICQLDFPDGGGLCYVPQALLKPHAKLWSLWEKHENPSEVRILFPNINEKLKHTFVHYLFTGNYEILESRDEAYVSDGSVEIRRAIEVIIFASEYQLSELQTMAETRLIQCFEPLSVQDILSHISWHKSIPIGAVVKDWVSGSFNGKVTKLLIDDPSVFAEGNFTLKYGKRSKLYGATVQQIIYALAGYITSLQQQVLINDAQPKDATGKVTDQRKVSVTKQLQQITALDLCIHDDESSSITTDMQGLMTPESEAANTPDDTPLRHKV